MSEPLSAMNMASFDGYCRISDAGPRGMVTVRGDLGRQAFSTAVKKITGVAPPDRRRINRVDDRALAWMSPDELLLMLPYDQVQAVVSEMENALSETHALVCNVSDARAVFRIEGSACREVLAKLAPVDLHPSAFAPGQIRRTRLAQVPAAFWMTDETCFEVMCFRSVAQYVFELLSESARLGGQVGYPRVIQTSIV